VTHLRFPRVEPVLQENPEDFDEALQDFDETISADLESTRNGMLAYKRTGGTELQFRRDQMEINEQLANECQKLRKTLALVVQSVNRKASKGSLKQMGVDIEAARVKRWESTRNWLVLFVAAAGFLVALVKELR